jgi:general secretion pathway protein L
MLGDFLDWWARQMFDLVPERLREFAVGNEEALVIAPDDFVSGPTRSVTLQLRRGGLVVRLGRFALDAEGLGAARHAVEAAGRPSAVRLCLPPELLLEKRLTLPISTERDLERVLAYEMDLETPFAPDDVWWSFEVEHRDRAQGKLQVRLSLVPKARVADLLEMLQRSGLPPTDLVIPTEFGPSRQLPLDIVPAHARPWRTRTMQLAAAGCVLLAMLAVVIPFMRQSLALAAVDERIGHLKALVDEVQQLRLRLDGSSGADVIEAERARFGDPLAVLAAATAILPDDTYLTDFAMRERKLNLNGQSAGAAKLIGALATDPTFKDPAFSAPVTHMEDTHMDVFSISAEARR